MYGFFDIKLKNDDISKRDIVVSEIDFISVLGGRKSELFCKTA